MLYRWTLSSLSTATFCVLFPYTVHGQQDLPVGWQGQHLRPLSLQSPAGQDSSPQAHIKPGGQPVDRDRSPQPSGLRSQSLANPHVQKPTGPNTQELPVVWPQSQPSSPPQQVVAKPQQPEQSTQQAAPPPPPSAVATPGYLGANTRNFYRERLCMHALTIRGVEVETVLPNSPAAQAGLLPARALTATETAIATAAGLLALTPAAAVAPALVSLSGGVPHGDIILAVNGQRVVNQEEFDNVMQQTQAQTTVYFTIHRGEANMHVPIRLGIRPTPTVVAVQ